MKFWYKISLTGFLLAFSLVAIAEQNMPDDSGEPLPEKLQVVTTTPEIGSIANFLAGDQLDVTVLFAFEEDMNPFQVSAGPRQKKLIENADLWIRTGLGLEDGWERDLIENTGNKALESGNPGYLDASDNIPIIPPSSDHISFDTYPHGNPYYWTDPLNGRIVAADITRHLSTILPEKANDFERSLEEFRKKLDVKMFGKALVNEVGGNRLWTLELQGKLDGYLDEEGLEKHIEGWKDRMSPLRNKSIITYHLCHHYFMRRFGIHPLFVLQSRPGERPPPERISKAIEKLKDGKADTLLVSPFHSGDAHAFIQGKTEVRTVSCPLTIREAPIPEGYFELIDEISRNLTGSL